MSNRPLITKELTDAVESLLNPYHDSRIYIAKEVTFDYRTEQACRVDLMRFKPINNTVSGIEKGDFYCYEVKSSVEDFHSKNGHNFIGDYNYYVMPKDVYDKVKGEIPYEVGVLVSDMEKDYGRITLYHAKNAKRKNRNKPLSEMLLMMFRSAVRDTISKAT